MSTKESTAKEIRRFLKKHGRDLIAAVERAQKASEEFKRKSEVHCLCDLCQRCGKRM